MKIQIDKNNLLTIFNENIPQTKKYTYNVSGYTFSDFDTGIIVLHKKEWKIINLKNLWDNMNVVYIAARKETIYPFNKKVFNKGLELFEVFDENTWKKYYFIPKFAEKEITPTNKILQTLGIKAQIEKTEKWFLIQGDIKKESQEISYLSFLYALTLLYGKIHRKNNELMSIKIHIPLFWQFLQYENIFDTMKNELIKKGIFINTSKQESNDGIIYQISCNDYEVLKNIAEYHKSIEKTNKIPKYDLTLKYKNQLIEFIQTNAEIPQEGKNEVVKSIEEWTIKLLTK